MFCQPDRPLSRRDLLAQAGLGFGALAALGVLGREGAASHALTPRAGHHRPRARAVISLFMHGGPTIGFCACFYFVACCCICFW